MKSILVWVVDGTRLKGDYRRFLKLKSNFCSIKPGIIRIDFPEDCFPAAWISSSVPVIFDFYGTELINNVQEKKILYCLFPQRIGRYAVLTEIPLEAFINTIKTGEWLVRTKNFMNLLDQTNKCKLK